MEYSRVQFEFLSHLATRMGGAYHAVTLDSYIDLHNQICSFKLWNLSGQFVGFQQYNYKGIKGNNNNNPKTGKYWTILPSKIGFYGLEYLNYSLPYLFITEGIFDAISILPYGNAIAVLSNNPKHLSEQIALLPFKKISICDGDKAGQKLAKYSDHVIICSDGEDANSLMIKNRLTEIISEYIVKRNLFEERLKWLKR